MRILLTGADGQLGKEIIKNTPDYVELIAMSKSEFNLYDLQKCKNMVFQIKPDWIINAGAYTMVDLAEKEKRKALIINGKAPLVLSEALKEIGGKLLQISTDYIFDGNQTSPYQTEQDINPINYYGFTKAFSEKAIKKLLMPTKQGIILRTSWLVGTTGNNFLKTMLKMHAEREIIKVVKDQKGCLTTTLSLSKICWKIIFQDSRRIFPYRYQSILHWCDQGVTSWYEIAETIGEIGKNIGVLKKNAKVIPISTSEYPTAAKRPKYSVLDCETTKKLLNVESRNWKDSLTELMYEI